MGKATTEKARHELEVGEMVEGRWWVLKKLGTGSFGEVNMVEDGTVEAGADGRRPRYAIKTESSTANAQILKMEVLVLKRLNEAGSAHACRLVARGRNDRVNYIVMSLCGPSLSDLRKRRPSRTFSLPTALRLAIHTLQSLEDIHTVGFLHRDIKDGNFAVDKATKREVIVLDFGLARSYVRYREAAASVSQSELRPKRANCGFRGTTLFAPLAAHDGEDMGRKDDLESWWYLVRAFVAPGLPWTNDHNKAEIEAAKRASREDGRLFLHLPLHLRHLLHYVDALDFPDTPDYSILYTLLFQAIASLPDPAAAHPFAPYDWHQDTT